MRYQNGKALKDSVPLSVVVYIIPMNHLSYSCTKTPNCASTSDSIRKWRNRRHPDPHWFSARYLVSPDSIYRAAHVDKVRVQRLYNASLSPPPWSSLRCRRHLGDRPPPDPCLHVLTINPWRNRHCCGAFGGMYAEKVVEM